jgi:hypothetical protein
MNCGSRFVLARNCRDARALHHQIAGTQDPLRNRAACGGET